MKVKYFEVVQFISLFYIPWLNLRRRISFSLKLLYIFWFIKIVHILLIIFIVLFFHFRPSGLHFKLSGFHFWPSCFHFRPSGYCLIIFLIFWKFFDHIAPSSIELYGSLIRLYTLHFFFVFILVII